MIIGAKVVRGAVGVGREMIMGTEDQLQSPITELLKNPIKMLAFTFLIRIEYQVSQT